VGRALDVQTPGHVREIVATYPRSTYGYDDDRVGYRERGLDLRRDERASILAHHLSAASVGHVVVRSMDVALIVAGAVRVRATTPAHITAKAMTPTVSAAHRDVVVRVDQIPKRRSRRVHDHDECWRR